jgi:ParB-like nuclease domain
MKPQVLPTWEKGEEAMLVDFWPIERFTFYVRNPRRNDAAVDRMCGSIREFGFKIPVLARSDGEVVDGHLRLKAAPKLGSWPGGDISQIPVILCDEWTPQQVKAFRLMVSEVETPTLPPMQGRGLHGRPRLKSSHIVYVTKAEAAF